MLTKTDFMKYVECPVYLWIAKHRPDLLPKETPELRRRFAIGRKVDDYARNLFPGGVDVVGYNREGWHHTKELMASGAHTIYQPTSMAGSLTCRADILQRDGGGWTLNEVKSATTVKPEYPYDVAFQRFCFEEEGLTIDKTNLVHINNQYVRQGDIEPEKLFRFEDITKLTLDVTDEVKSMIPLALEILGRKAEPDQKMFASCPNPKTCEYLKIYLESIGHKFELPKIEEVTDKRGIQEALSVLQYPLYFLDYETYGEAIPPFDGTRPYQNIPFQYSLGIKDAPDAEPRYMAFLTRKFENPVPDLLAQLKRDIGSQGSVIVWNQGFEMGCNDEMGRMEPSCALFLKSVNDRVFDLMLIFKLKRQLYTRNAFEGSASLKKVLPVICPELAYDSLEIQEGMEASISWPILTDQVTPEDEKSKLAKNMLEYCKRDTEAMICILERLREVIK